MSAAILAYSMLCIFLAAIVRGYSGFGFSLLAISSLALVLPVSDIIPAIFMMEVAASLSLLPSIFRDVDWRALRALWLGCLLATPLGVWLLASLPVAPMKIALSIAVIAAAALLWSGYARKTLPSTGETVATGALAGLLNGAFGIVAPPVIVFFFNSPAGMTIGRASLIAFFIGTDAIGLLFLGLNGLVTSESLWRFLVFIPALLIGQWIGARSFKSADPAKFRLWVLRILMVLAVLIGIQGLRGLMQA